VIVIQGDASTVDDGRRRIGVTDDNARAIVKRSSPSIPTTFDTIQYFLSFLDLAHDAARFYAPIKTRWRHRVARSTCGPTSDCRPTEERLSGYSNMNDMQMWATSRSSRSRKDSFYAVMSQELSHRWMMFMKFKDASAW